MASTAAIRITSTSTAKSAFQCIQLHCHVKPGASKQREGIMSITENVIELCVSAQPRDGEANKAVRNVFRKIFKCPLSDVTVIRGLKSREKTISIAGIDAKGDPKNYVSWIRGKLEDSVQ